MEGGPSRSALPLAAAIMMSLSVLGPLAHAREGGEGDPGDARRAELLNLLRHDCGACHGITLSGGLGPSLRPADLATLSDGAIAAAILGGAPGTPMPAWAGELGPGDVTWLVRRLRQGLGDGE